MFILYADKNRLAVRQREMLTSGSVNVNLVRFELSEDWNGLTRTAVFKAGDTSRSVLLDESGVCSIPWEVLVQAGWTLSTGVYGACGGEVVLPTVWASLGTILAGASPGDEARPPTPELWAQELEKKQNKLAGQPGQVVGFDETGQAVPVDTAETGGLSYQFGHGFKVAGDTVSVDAVSNFEGDNTLPMTAAGVQASVGNIEALLGTI